MNMIDSITTTLGTQGISYGNGIYVLKVYNNSYYTSTDLINWSSLYELNVKFGLTQANSTNQIYYYDNKFIISSFRSYEFGTCYVLVTNTPNDIDSWTFYEVPAHNEELIPDCNFNQIIQAPFHSPNSRARGVLS